MATPAPQDVQSLIDQAEAYLKQTTSKYNASGKYWKLAFDKLAAARVEAGQLVSPVAPPPTGLPLGMYDAGNGNYSADWDAIKAAIPKANFMMAPQDSSVITHIGTNTQWVQYLSSFFMQYGIPCWETGLVEGFMVYDEPGTDSASLADIKNRISIIKSNCTGVNNKGQTVKTSVTAYDASTLTTLANANLGLDVLMIDRYPSRDGWNYTQWNACVAACDAAVAASKIAEYWIVLDAFQVLPNYPAPTQAQLEDQIARSKATNAKRLVAYSWGPDAGSPELSQLPGLVSALNII